MEGEKQKEKFRTLIWIVAEPEKRRWYCRRQVQQSLKKKPFDCSVRTETEKAMKRHLWSCYKVLSISTFISNTTTTKNYEEEKKEKKKKKGKKKKGRKSGLETMIVLLSLSLSCFPLSECLSETLKPRTTMNKRNENSSLSLSLSLSGWRCRKR